MSLTPTPKDRFTSLDTLAVVRELRRLDRARVDKAFDVLTGGWSLVLRAPGEGRRELVLVPGRYAALLPEATDHTEELSPFARELRRLLTGAALRGVAEPGGERFLELKFGRTDEPSELLLAFEIFGSGNLVVAREGKIVAVAYPRQWAHRTVRVGAAYARPPSRADPWALGAEELGLELGRSRTDLTSTLAARLALGGPLAEELIVRGGWNPQEAAAHTPDRVGARLHEEMRRLRDEVGDRPSGHLYRHEGAPVDATPYPSRRWEAAEGVETTVTATFSEAAHEYFSALVPPTVSAEETAATRARQDLEHLVEQQRRAVSDLANSVEGLQAQAEAIFAHYPEAEAALAAVPREGEAPRRIEVVLGGVPASLFTDRSPRESAQGLFEESKRVQGKLAGARAALQESERRTVLPSSGMAARGPPGAPKAPARHRVHWFERFRWFISSEGAVVVGGRDANSNDQVVKRHLKEGDIYLHADLHGAASVVVKHPAPGSPPLTEATYREAGQWAVAFSKAWRAGLASASAFWVTHDQVSKSAGTGEFVARGAWAIHGTKNLLRDLPTELALGTIDYEGESLWTAAPPEAVRRRGTVRVLLTPGPERERSDREVELARELGIARPLLQSLLPAGGISVRRA
jgi:predicted ribosome quality control (RQC) complex YloA/Tae2 family protein